MILRTRHGAALGSVALAVACQSYRPIPLSAAPEVEAVRVELTAAAAERLALALGPNVASLDGRVAELTADTIRLAVADATLANGQSVAWRGERVALARGDVAAVRQRRPSTARSALLGLVVVGGAFLAARQLGRDSAEGRGTGGVPVPR